jgi:hypothetical protein
LHTKQSPASWFHQKKSQAAPLCHKLLNISPPIPNYVTMQGHISKSSYTRKQRKEFLRTWTAIGRAHVSASHGLDLFQLLDIASSSLAADHDCDDCGSLCTAHPSPAAGSPSCTPNSTAVISTSNHSGLRGKRQAGSGQASELGRSLFGGFTSAAPAPPPTGNILFGSK